MLFMDPYFNPYIDEITYEYYHGYTLFDKENIPVAYPFGFGLSYTTFEYADLTLASTEFTDEDTIEASVMIKNIGSVAGEEVVQLYVGFKNSAIDRPVKLLRDFDKIFLQPNEEKMVAFKVPVKDLGFYNAETLLWEVEQMVYELFVGGSSREGDLLGEVFEILK